MSVPNDQVLNLIKKQGPKPDAGPSPNDAQMGMSDSSSAPMASPMATPEPKMGNKEGAMVNISMAMDLIEQALPSLGSESEEGQKAMGALRSLTGILGQKKQKTKELQSSEIMQMLQNLPGAGGATPEGRAMAQAPAIPNMPPMGGAPGGMPPGGPPGMTPPPAPM